MLRIIHQLKQTKVVIFCLLGFIAPVASGELKDLVRVSVNGAVPNILGWDGEKFTGAYRNSASCILKQLPYIKDVNMVPIARLKRLMELDRTDIVLLLAKNAHRDEYGTYSTPVVATSNILITKLEAAPSLEQSMAMKVATIRGSTFVELIKRELKSEVIEVDNWNSALRMMEIDRVHGVYSAKIIADREIDSDLIDQFNVLPISEINGGAYIRKSHPEHEKLVQLFNNAASTCINISISE